MRKTTNKLMISLLFFWSVALLGGRPLLASDSFPPAPSPPAACSLQLDSVWVTPADCGQENGTVTLASSGGDAPLKITFIGPVNGHFISADAVNTITDLPAGVYQIQQLDQTGCLIQAVATVTAGQGFSVAVVPFAAVCGEPGAALVALSGSSGPYAIGLTGPDTMQMQMLLDTFELEDLPAGDYQLTVTDPEGCFTAASFSVEVTAGDLALDVASMGAPCGGTGSMTVEVQNGTPPFVVEYSGPVAGNFTVMSALFQIDSLPAGFYDIGITDAAGCSLSETVAQTGLDLQLEAVAGNGSCGENGSIELQIAGGVPAYTLHWDGPATGNTTTSDPALTLSGLPAGLYLLSLIDAEDCETFALVELPDGPDSLAVVLSGNDGACGQNGSISVNLSGGCAPFQIEWSGPQTDVITVDGDSTLLSDLPPGTYTIAVADANGTQVVQEVSFASVAGNISLFTVPINGNCNGLGAIWLDVIGGAPPFVISWDGPASGSLTTDDSGLAILDLPSGFYLVTTVDANGCVATDQVVINNQASDLALEFTINEGTCQYPGWIHVKITGGSGPYSISWEGPESGSITVDASGYFIPQLFSGTYQITVTDAYSCTVSGAATILNEGDPQLTATPHPGICEQPGAITVSVEGGEPPFTYAWGGPVAGSTVSTEQEVLLSGLPAGNYSITVTDGTGCGATLPVELNTTGSVAVTVVPEPGDCGQPGSISIGIAGGTGPYAYQWSGPSSGTTTAGEALIAVGNLPSGNYAVTVTDANGCTDSATVTLTNNPGILLTAVPFPGECGAPGSIFVDITNGAAPFTYVWSGPVSGSTMTGEDWITVTDLPSGTYTFVATDANGCGDSVTVTLDNEPGPEVTATAHPGECGALGSIFINVTGGSTPYTYIWSGPVSGSTMTSNNQLSVNDLPSGTYTIVVADANDCGESETVTLVNDPAPEVTAVPYPGECGASGSIFVDIVNGPAPYTYVWTGPVSGSTTTSEDWITVADLPSGTYTFIVTDANGCSDSVTVTLTNEPPVEITVVADDGDCGGDGSIQVTVTAGTPPFTYVWSGPEAGSLVTSETSLTLDDPAPGNYTIAVTDANDCGDSATVTVETVDIFTIVSLPEPGPCGQNGNIWIDFFNGTPPFIVTWTGPVSGSTTTTAFGINIGDLPGGVYTVVVTDHNGCEAGEVVDLVIPPYDLDLTVTPNPGGCGANGSITVTVSGGAPNFNLSWSGLINGDTVTSGDTFVFDDLPDGTVTFEVTDANFCILSETVTLDNNAANPVVTLTPTSGTCGEDGSIQVYIANGTPPFTIVWSGPVSGSTMTSDNTFLLDDLPGGAYTVVVTDANACGDSASTSIDNSGEPVNFIAVPTNGQCGDPGSIAVEITNAIAPYTITWTGPVSGSLVTSVAWNTISDLPSGEYTIVVTGSDGCSAGQVVTVNNEEDVPVLTAEAINGICGQSGSIEVTISGGAPPYDLIWNGPVSGSQVITDNQFLISGLPGGVYTVTVVDGHNCAASTTVTIDPSDDNLNVTVQPIPGECGENGSVVLTFEEGVAPYTVVWGGPVSGSNMTSDATYTIFNLPAGFYNIVVTDANGCSAGQMVEISHAGDGLEAEVSVLDGACGVPGSIWITVLTGEPPFIIDWSGPVSGSDTTNLYEYDIFDLPEGSYMVKITDANGCMYVTTVFIVDYPNDLALSLTPNTGICGDPGSIGVAVSGGLAPFEINWTGPATGSQTINGNMYTIAGLPAGSYTVSVVDANACVRTATAQLGDPGVAMDVTLTAVNADCENAAFLQVDISGGAPGYDISWTGPESDTVSTMSTSFTIASLSEGTYTVTVADAAGCIIEQTAQITNDGQSTGADFSFSVNGLTVSFTNNSPNGTYAWTFGDGGSSTEANPVYTYDTEGTYEVCLTVDGNCGTSTLCQDVTVQAPPAPAMLMTGTAGGEDGEMVSVPVSIQGLDVLATVSGSIGLSDPSVATFMGIAPGAIQPAFNVNNGSFSYYDPNGVGIPVDDGTVLFYVQLQLHGSPGISTEVFLSDDPLPVEVSSMINNVLTIVPHTTVSGQVSIEAVMSLISGEVQSLWGAGIPEVMVEVNGAGYQHYQMTDAAGHYGMAPAPMGHLYTVTPERNGNPATGLSSYALYQGQRFLLGLPTPLIHSPYQVIAGDVNGNNMFNELDLLITQQVLLGINDGFPGGKVWQFVAADQPMPADFDAFNVFPYASAQSLMVMHDTTVNFVGVRSGDLLGEAVPGYTPDPATESPEDLILEIVNQSVAAGEIIEIPVRSANFESIVSYQLGLLFDTHQLAFLGFEGGDADGLHTVLAALSGAMTGELRLSWFHRQGQSATAGSGEPLFYLRFAALQDIDDWNGLLQVDPNSLPARAHNAAGMAMDIVLQVEGATSVGLPDDDAFRLYQNLPNPLRHSTVIPFDLPRAGEAELLIRDQYGRLVQRLEGDFAGGRNVFEVDGSALPAGMYYYTLRSGGFVDTRGMVVL